MQCFGIATDVCVRDRFSLREEVVGRVRRLFGERTDPALEGAHEVLQDEIRFGSFDAALLVQHFFYVADVGLRLLHHRYVSDGMQSNPRRCCKYRRRRSERSPCC